MTTLPIGTPVRSLRTSKISGIVVGYGALSWTGGGIMQPVYLVQISEGSSALGPACAVLRADQVELDYGKSETVVEKYSL